MSVDFKIVSINDTAANVTVVVRVYDGGMASVEERDPTSREMRTVGRYVRTRAVKEMELSFPAKTDIASMRKALAERLAGSAMGALAPELEGLRSDRGITAGKVLSERARDL